MNKDESRKKQQDLKEEETENRVNQLVNEVNRYTRTERHLEQHSDIGDPDRLAHVYEVQDRRKEDIDNLKNVIAHGESSNTNELENLQKNYEYTKNYVAENKDHMDSDTLKNTNEKQKHRKDQIDSLS